MWLHGLAVNPISCISAIELQVGIPVGINLAELTFIRK